MSHTTVNPLAIHAATHPQQVEAQPQLIASQLHKRHNMKEKNTVVIIPAFNEAEGLAIILPELIRLKLPIIVINDGSTDNTANILKEFNITTIQHERNLGYCSAVIAGIRQSIISKFDTIITIDADMAHDTNDIIPLLHHHFETESDLTIGNRFTKTKQNSITTSKMLSNSFASHLIMLTTKININDVACGFRAISSRLCNLLASSTITKGYGLPYETIYVAVSNNMKVTSTPVHVHYDGFDLLGTAQGELADFIKTILQYSSTDTINDQLLRLLSDVETLSPALITTDQHTFVLFPISSHKIYLSQPHDKIFKYNKSIAHYNFTKAHAKTPPYDICHQQCKPTKETMRGR